MENKFIIGSNRKIIFAVIKLNGISIKSKSEKCGSGEDQGHRVQIVDPAFSFGQGPVKIRLHAQNHHRRRQWSGQDKHNISVLQLRLSLCGKSCPYDWGGFQYQGDSVGEQESQAPGVGHGGTGKVPDHH